MKKLKFKFISSGRYLPQKVVTAKEMASLTQVDEEWILKKTGVQTRYVAEGENQAQMGAKAVLAALKNSSVKVEDIDLLISASGTPDQPIPHNSALIHKELNFPSSVVAIDVGATCLSFVQALQVAASFLTTEVYRHIIIVSSEKPSVGLNLAEPESAALFGDGAVAFILSRSENEEGFMFSEFETHNEFVHATEIPAGGTRLHPKDVGSSESSQFLFSMDGAKVFKVTSKLFPSFFERNLQKHRLSLDQFTYIVPHQASLLGLRLMQQKLEIPEEKFVINIQRYGNLVGASIPMALHDLLEEKRLREGDQVLILATAAGLTFGMVGLQL